MYSPLPHPLLPTQAPASPPDGVSSKFNLSPPCCAMEESQVVAERSGTGSPLPPHFPTPRGRWLCGVPGGGTPSVLYGG